MRVLIETLIENLLGDQKTQKHVRRGSGGFIVRGPDCMGRFESCRRIVCFERSQQKHASSRRIRWCWKYCYTVTQVLGSKGIVFEHNIKP